MADLPIDHRAVRRVNLSIPVADESVIQWLDAQENKSVSVRAIIKEYIEKYGYADAFCRPIVQGPRRGRPPLTHDEDFSRDLETVTRDTRRVDNDESSQDHGAEDSVFDDDTSTKHEEPIAQDDVAPSDGELQFDEHGMPMVDY